MVSLLSCLHACQGLLSLYICSPHVLRSWASSTLRGARTRTSRQSAWSSAHDHLVSDLHIFEAHRNHAEQRARALHGDTR